MEKVIINTTNTAGGCIIKGFEFDTSNALYFVEVDGQRMVGDSYPIRDGRIVTNDAIVKYEWSRIPAIKAAAFRKSVAGDYTEVAFEEFASDESDIVMGTGGSMVVRTRNVLKTLVVKGDLVAQPSTPAYRAVDFDQIDNVPF